MAKVEVQVRSCFCCGLSLGTVFIAIYALLLYSLLSGLALWGLSDTANYGDASHYNSCEAEAQGILDHKIKFQEGTTTLVIEDSTTSYHCSWGLYTEEMKFSKAPRYSLLLFNICLYVLLVLASVILLIGLAIYSEWLLIPWILLMAVDIFEESFRSSLYLC